MPALMSDVALQISIWNLLHGILLTLTDAATVLILNL
jgi:hypothetical protein